MCIRDRYCFLGIRVELQPVTNFEMRLIKNWLRDIKYHLWLVVVFEISKDMEELLQMPLPWRNHIPRKHRHCHQDVKSSKFADPSKHGNQGLIVLCTSWIKFFDWSSSSWYPCERGVLTLVGRHWLMFASSVSTSVTACYTYFSEDIAHQGFSGSSAPSI